MFDASGNLALKMLLNNDGWTTADCWLHDAVRSLPQPMFNDNLYDLERDKKFKMGAYQQRWCLSFSGLSFAGLSLWFDACSPVSHDLVPSSVLVT